jgi:hypothetical protein
MRKIIAAMIILTAAFTITRKPVKSLELKTHNLILVVDSSKRMNTYWGKKRKIDVMRDSLKASFEDIHKISGWGLNMGIRAFGNRGSRNKMGSSDTWKVTAVEWFDPITLSNALDGLKPNGKAPVSIAIREAEHDIPPVKNPPLPWNAMILITAGGNDYNQDMTIIAKQVKAGPTIDGIYIIGLNLNSKDSKAYQKVATETNGYFVNVTSAKNLTSTIVDVVTKHATPASVDL